MSGILKLIISENDFRHYSRLDQCLQGHFTDLSRTQIKDFFLEGFISSNTHALQLSKLPPINTEVNIQLPLPRDYHLKGEDIPLDIVFEDQHLMIINKPAGMVVHPAAGNWSGTLVHAILHHYPEVLHIGQEKRPGIVHRLDKGTSGLLVVAKNHKTLQGLTETFKKHNIKRKYMAITIDLGFKNNSGTLQSLIARSPQNRKKMSTKVNVGKNAITHYQIIHRAHKLALFELNLETGRTHQIRVHLAELLKSPILNDETYGNPPKQKLQLNAEINKIIGDYSYPFLHATKLGFQHPITNCEIECNSPPPEPFSLLLPYLSQ